MLNMESTMHVLPVVAVAISLSQLGHAQAPSDHDDTTSTATTTTTLTSTITHTQTVTRGGAKESVSTTNPGTPHDMTSEGKEYVLQGCYAQGGIEDIGTILGQNYTAPEMDNMSLSLCLKACSLAVVAGSTLTYPFVGVASGDSCYCGMAINMTTSESSLTDCTLPCVDNDGEACGGKGFMSVYKSASLQSAAQPNISSSSVGSLASSNPAAETSSASSNDNGATLSGLGNMDASDAKNPGVIAGITIGSVSGVIGLLVLVFMAAKWCTTRKQLHPATAASDSASSSVTTLTATTNIHDAASIRDAMKIDLRRLDGVVMDQHSPSPRFARKNQIGVAATTGADWQSNKDSPLTPRTPRFVDVMEETQPSTPSILIHPPDIAPVHGLGERAWHRRRLSAPFPPAGPVVMGVAAVESENRDDRRALPSQSSGDMPAVDSADKTTWCAGQEAVSVLSEDETRSTSSSWRWTMSTASETPDVERERENVVNGHEMRD
ncbi:hypothetical protein N0V93_009437 [Gnomoniopsis smithogilvyi]|uniref:WSC domain-containing protein n=1 Tax=Gnomoniopsis smithogilvyi TaxID=1191159 RepID=A0A9W8YMT7_9PEZI|nr:hypothetical protein N0V93_009437 [Gnomoniopsis smithogilvyi]